jgi:hypothetical protein
VYKQTFDYNVLKMWEKLRNILRRTHIGLNMVNTSYKVKSFEEIFGKKSTTVHDDSSFQNFSIGLGIQTRVAIATG